MKKFTDLKQYLEKELHAKRFLQEGLDVMTTLENAADEHASILKQIEAGRKELVDISNEKVKATKSLDLINARIAEKAADCETLLDKAREKAKGIVAEAYEEAKKTMTDTTEALAEVNEAIVAGKKELAGLKTEIEDLLKTKENINKDLDKLRKKFAGE